MLAPCNGKRRGARSVPHMGTNRLGDRSSSIFSHIHRELYAGQASGRQKRWNIPFSAMFSAAEDTGDDANLVE